MFEQKATLEDLNNLTEAVREGNQVIFDRICKILKAINGLERRIEMLERYI